MKLALRTVETKLGRTCYCSGIQSSLYHDLGVIEFGCKYAKIKNLGFKAKCVM